MLNTTIHTCAFFVKKKSCNGAVVLLYMQKCRQVKFIKILWAHTGYIMYKYDLRTIILNFDIKKFNVLNFNEKRKLEYPNREVILPEESLVFLNVIHNYDQ